MEASYVGGNDMDEIIRNDMTDTEWKYMVVIDY